MSVRLDRLRVWCAIAAAATLALVEGCKGSGAEGTRPATSASAEAARPGASASVVAARAALPIEPAGDPVKGKALVAELECSRCHEGTGTPVGALEKQCFGCHVEVMAGRFPGPPAAQQRWRKILGDLQDAPSLTSSQKRFRRSWLVSFLLEPYDVRPRLGPTMPRLALTPEQARDIAAYVGMPGDGAEEASFAGADPARGRSLIEAKGCPSCHAFTGVPPLAGAAPINPGETGIKASVALAPDLRTTRDRVRPAALIAWITEPKALKPDTAMPEFKIPPDEARDIAAYIVSAPLAAAPPKAIPARLPVLERPVRYDEVSARVFRRTCWHCHGEPDYAAGDGGPGNTGGFGFKPRGLNFVDYGSVLAGFQDDQGNRHSVFETVAAGPFAGSTRLVAALLARQAEEAGRPSAEVRGMPLGYPSLTPEDIQLVETWVAQGRPR